MILIKRGHREWIVAGFLATAVYGGGKRLYPQSWLDINMFIDTQHGMLRNAKKQALKEAKAQK